MIKKILFNWHAYWFKMHLKFLSKKYAEYVADETWKAINDAIKSIGIDKIADFDPRLTKESFDAFIERTLKE